MSTAIIVAGMHRSGTSATTGALQLAGVSLGKVLEPAPDNPKGYFENKRAVEVHERLLGGLGRSWDDIRELPTNWLSSEAAANAKREIMALVDEEFSEKSIWAVKDPRICRFIPLWRDVLGARQTNIVVMFVARNPEEVASSIRKRNGWDLPLGRLLWMRYVFEAEEATRGLLRTVVSYDRLLDNPEAAISRALTNLRVMAGTVGEFERLANIKDFVDVRERHHSYSHEDGSEDKFSEALQACYRELISIDSEVSGWERFLAAADRAKEALPGAWRYLDSVADQAGKHRHNAIAFEIDAAETRSKLIAQINWSEGAVVVQNELRRQLEASDEAAKQGKAQVAALFGTHITTLHSAIQELGLQHKELAEERISLQEQRKLVFEKQALDSEQVNELIRRNVESVERVIASNELVTQSLAKEREQWAKERAEYEERFSKLQFIIHQERDKFEERYAEFSSQREHLAQVVADLRIRLGELTASNEEASEKARLYEEERRRFHQRENELEANVVQLGESVRTLTSDLHATASENASMNQKMLEISVRMEMMNRSLSWRMTQPFRAIASAARKLFR